MLWFRRPAAGVEPKAILALLPKTPAHRVILRAQNHPRCERGWTLLWRRPQSLVNRCNRALNGDRNNWHCTSQGTLPNLPQRSPVIWTVTILGGPGTSPTRFKSCLAAPKFHRPQARPWDRTSPAGNAPAPQRRISKRADKNGGWIVNRPAQRDAKAFIASNGVKCCKSCPRKWLEASDWLRFAEGLVKKRRHPYTRAVSTQSNSERGLLGQPTLPRPYAF